MIFSICNANGMTPGRPPQVEAPTAAQALEFWAKSRGFADYQAAKAAGHSKRAHEIPAEIVNGPRSIRTFYEIWVRAKAGSPIGSFSQSNFDGSQAECRDWGRARAADTNLPVVDVPGVIRDLEGPDFMSPGIYIRAIQFDELAPGETRVYRR